MTIRATGLDYAVDMIHAVCRLAGAPSLIDDFQTELRHHGIAEAIDRHDTTTLFDWLAAALSFQGVSDRIAYEYMARHGQATWDDLARSLTRAPPCPKLRSYWHFHNCRYHKGSGTCAEPEHLADCPLPVHDLRNGRLNQTAYSLFLFTATSRMVTWSAGLTPSWPRPTLPMNWTGLHGFDRPCCHLWGRYSASQARTWPPALGRGRLQHDRGRHPGAQFPAPDRHLGPPQYQPPVRSSLLPAVRLHWGPGGGRPVY
jgi:hypothetical protein